MNYKNKIQFNYKMISYTFYQIVCNDSNITETYIGSTKDLNDRISKHKNKCNNSNSIGYNIKVYKFIRANGGWNNFKFNILEIRDCINDYESYKIEQSYINELKSELNSYSPYTGLTRQEYMKQYNTQYKQDNKKKISQQEKEQYCCLICNGRYTRQNTSRHFTSNKHKKHLNK